VRDDVCMSDTEARQARPEAPSKDEGVLANLPRTRPQRSSPRRAAARRATVTEQGTGTVPAGLRAPSSARRRKPAAKAQSDKRARSAAKRAGDAPLRRDAAPRQGFESEGEAMRGIVHPPGGTELVASAAEIVGDLAKAGLSSGERLLKDVLSRLRPS